MAYKILPVGDDDLFEAQAVTLSSLGTQEATQELVSAQWPGWDTMDGQANALARFKRMKDTVTDPELFLKLIDQATSEQLAVAICGTFDKPPKSIPLLQGVDFPTKEDEEYAQHLRARRNELLLRTHAQIEGSVVGLLLFPV